MTPNHDALQDLYHDHPEKVPGKILVIEIKPFPDAADNKSDSENQNADRSQNADTFLHLLAPLLAVDTVRDHIQIGMAEGSFYAAAKRWELEAYNPARKTQLPEIKIQLFSVQFQSKESVTPLSWHLRESEKRDIDAAWETFAKDRSMSAIQKFFNSE